MSAVALAKGEALREGGRFRWHCVPEKAKPWGKSLNQERKTMSKKNLFIFPKPTGKYSVGTKALHIPASGESRELMVQLWYPTDEQKQELGTYAPEYLLTSLKDVFKMFEVTDEDVKEVDSIRVHAISNAQISQQKNAFPLIIASHGYYATRFNLTALSEELASNGYVVAAIDHTNGCAITQFPDGRIERWKPLTKAEETSDEFYEHFKKRIDIRTADIRFVVDQLTKLNSNDNFFANKIDVNKIGLMGHSLGGETVLHATLADDRIGAVAALDPFPAGNLLPDTFSKPFLLMLAEKNHWIGLKSSEKKKDELKSQDEKHKKLCTKKVAIEKSNHIIFTDFALFNHFKLFEKIPADAEWIRKGEADGFAAIKEIRNHLVSFFNEAF